MLKQDTKLASQAVARQNKADADRIYFNYRAYLIYLT